MHYVHPSSNLTSGTKRSHSNYGVFHPEKIWNQVVNVKRAPGLPLKTLLYFMLMYSVGIFMGTSGKETVVYPLLEFLLFAESTVINKYSPIFLCIPDSFGFDFYSFQACMEDLL